MWPAIDNSKDVAIKFTARISPSGKLLCFWNVKTIETVNVGQQPNLLDHWADTNLHIKFVAALPAVMLIDETNNISNTILFDK